MTPRIEACGLVVERAGQRVIDGVDLCIDARTITTIEGPSGGGKSTLLRALATLVEPAAGRIFLDGVDASSIDPRAFRVRVAYVPQQPEMFDGSVADNIAAGPLLRGVSMSHLRVRDLLSQVGLDEGFAGRKARDLSGGERQRVAMARALANGPEVLLLDEPTSALDPASASTVIALTRRLADEGKAVVVVTHVRAHADALGGSSYVCGMGKLRRELHRHPVHAAARGGRDDGHPDANFTAFWARSRTRSRPRCAAWRATARGRWLSAFAVVRASASRVGRRRSSRDAGGGCMDERTPHRARPISWSSHPAHFCRHHTR